MKELLKTLENPKNQNENPFIFRKLDESKKTNILMFLCDRIEEKTTRYGENFDVIIYVESENGFFIIPYSEIAPLFTEEDKTSHQGGLKWDLLFDSPDVFWCRGKKAKDAPRLNLGEHFYTFEKMRKWLTEHHPEWENLMGAESSVFTSNEEPSVWIFQGNPAYYDITGAVEALDTITWGTNQSQKQIKKGDKAYIWMAGPDGGIVASGKILCDPEMRNPDHDDPYLRNSAIEGDPSLKVDIHIERKLTRNRISRTLLTDDERTKNMQILTFPGATNFRVTKAEDDVIESIIDGSYSRVPVVDEQKTYWFVLGRPKRRNEFLDNGYWELAEGSWDVPRWQKAIREMKVGDKIALKTSSGTTAKPDGKPYNEKGQKISWMKIAATGTVTEASQDGKSVKVDWKVRFAEERIWYYFNYFPSIWKVEPTDDWRRLLIDFAFNDGKQDLDYWRNAWLGFDADKEAESDANPDTASLTLYDNIDLNEIKKILDYKKQVILFGPPGTGKTFKANEYVKIEYSGKDREQYVRCCTFHPEYGYEHFIEGYRPQTRENDQMSFKRKDGIFKTLCERAKEAWEQAEDKDEAAKFYLIIDEINRGDIPRIFGELITLIEKDKRNPLYAIDLPLSQSCDDIEEGDEKFWVPPNVYIIATMNTADRSIALLDTALRRRFGFYEMKPDSTVFEKIGLQYAVPKCGKSLPIWFDKLNAELSKHLKSRHDAEHILIGHSFFIQLRELKDPRKRDERFEQIVKYEILPLIQEYCYENKEALEQLEKYISDTTGVSGKTKAETEAASIDDAEAASRNDMEDIPIGDTQ